MNKKRRFKPYIALMMTLAVLWTVVPVGAAEAENAVPQGDINGDGAVTAADAAVLMRAALGIPMGEDALQASLDITGNGVSDAADAEVVLLYAAGYAETLADITASLDGSLLGEKYLSLFSYREPVKTETTYASSSVYVSQSLIRYKDTNCFVADIYLRDIENLRVAFSSGKLNGKIQTVKKMAQNNNAIIAINADYYIDNNHNAYLLRNGSLYHSGTSKLYDTCVLYRDGHMSAFSPNTKASVLEAEGEPWQTWTFGPSLINEDGTAKTAFTCNKSILGINPRTAIGYYEPGHYCFVVADGRAGKVSRGLKMEDLASFMAEELCCTFAYNLDGGQTSAMAMWGEIIDSPFNGGRSTSDIVYICDAAYTGETE